MAIWSIISTSQIEYKRIDADYYHPQYLDELTKWSLLNQNIGVSKLKFLLNAPVRTGHTPRSRNIINGESCVKFIKTDNVREGNVDFNNSAFLPCRVLSTNDYIPHDSVVVTIIGATPEIVGRTAIVRETDPLCVTNQNVAVLTTNEKCDPYYLTAYLQTIMGRNQLWRHSRQTEQVNLNCREVERILIPCPSKNSQNEIGKLVRESFEYANRSETVILQAQQFLELEFGLDKMSFQKAIGYSSSFSEVIENGRADADYFQLKYRVIRKFVHLYPGGFQRLIDISNLLKPNFDPSLTPNEHYRYIELADINSNLGIVNDNTTYSGKDMPSRARRRVSKGDVIASSVVGSVDKAAIIGESNSGSIASTGFFHLRPNEISAEYLLILLRSKCVTMQLQQEATGGILSAVPDSRLKYVIIPKLHKEIQDQITNLVTEAQTLKRESDIFLGEAKARVEQLIEEAASI
jgi:type I restriction enzyme, S subunit